MGCTRFGTDHTKIEKISLKANPDFQQRVSRKISHEKEHPAAFFVLPKNRNTGTTVAAGKSSDQLADGKLLAEVAAVFGRIGASGLRRRITHRGPAATSFG